MSVVAEPFPHVYKHTPTCNHRWNPAAPIGRTRFSETGIILTNAAGVPHLTTADDVYKGYYIPKGTIVIANIQ